MASKGKIVMRVYGKTENCGWWGGGGGGVVFKINKIVVHFICHDVAFIMSPLFLVRLIIVGEFTKVDPTAFIKFEYWPYSEE